jgi:hypothetical protein
MTSLFQDDLDNPRQLSSVKDLYSNSEQHVSVVGQRPDTRSFVDFVKRIEMLRARERTRERLFCQLRNSVGDLRHEISDSMIVDRLMIKTIMIWPNGAQIQECADILREVQTYVRSDQTTTEDTNIWKRPPVSVTINHR